MIVRYNQNYDPDLMGSLLSDGWKKISHATKVNISNIGKAGKSALSATKTNWINAGKYAGKVWDYTPEGIIYDAITGNKNPILNAVKVNATNAKKELAKLSMNKIIDSLTPDAPMPDTGDSGIMKYLPIAAAGIGALTLLM